MLPDGYWDMTIAEGGRGAVLLLPAAHPLVYGLMIPEFLGKQLLTAEPGPGKEPKVQRNTQAEIIAIVTGLLTWAEQLRGKIC